jgi:hypothetical protein
MRRPVWAVHSMAAKDGMMLVGVVIPMDTLIKVMVRVHVRVPSLRRVVRIVVGAMLLRLL